MTRPFMTSIAFALCFAAAGPAAAQRVQLGIESRDVFQDVPFVLTISAEGFDEDPQPVVTPFQIKDASVRFLDVSPNVMQSISVINGRRTQSKQVTFVFRYKVVPGRTGDFTIPSVEVTQGKNKATGRGGDFAARNIGTTNEMRIELSVPERELWVGETFDVGIDWLLRRDPQSPNFLIPLFESPDTFRVTAVAEEKGKRTLEFQVGDKELALPYSTEKVTRNGREYNRFRFVARVTPQKAGTFKLPAATVIAALQMGIERDRYGRRTRSTGIYKAVDRPREMTIKPLPSTDRPPGFAGAVGTGFSIEAQASRTVVRVGDPIELSLSIRGDAFLDALRPPDLAGEHALPGELFEIIDASATGEPSKDGKARVFRVTVRLKSTNVREIPGLPFSYFNPKKGTYDTARSQPIALSVAGSSVVGAGQVVSGARVSQKQTSAPPTSGPGADADLALSAASRTMDSRRTVSELVPLLVALYLFPLLVFGIRFWQVKTRERRGKASQSRRARKAADEAIDRAGDLPARDSVAKVVSALKALARENGHRPAHRIIDRLETEGYAPGAATTPLAEALLTEAKGLAMEWDRRSSSPVKGATVTVLLATALSLGTASPAHADDAPGSSPRDLYASALSIEDRAARAQAFSTAARAFAARVLESPDRPELLTDWGNAALGAHDFGTAALAYRRALLLDRSLTRATKNLDWLRARAPEDMPRAREDSAVDALFFWHASTSRATKHLTAGFAFLLFGLLLAPWSPSMRRQRTFRRLALVPALVCVAMWSSLALERSEEDDVVVVGDAVVLRVADSMGAQAARPKALPPGSEGQALEERNGWVRASFPGGYQGWLPESAVSYVVRRRGAD